MLSKKCQYAIRAVLYLATESSKDHLIGGKEVSEKLDIPLAFTLKILQELSRHAIITSVKGPGGGFYLSEANQEGTLFDIVRVLCDPLYFERCGLGLKECDGEHPCPFHDAFEKTRNILLHALQSRNIREFISEMKQSEIGLII